MSGMKGRLLTRIDSHPPVYVKGFNDSKSKVASIGLNEDGMNELYIPSMSEELVLLCAQEYAQKYGAAVLYKNDGVIITEFGNYSFLHQFTLGHSSFYSCLPHFTLLFARQ